MKVSKAVVGRADVPMRRVVVGTILASGRRTKAIFFAALIVLSTAAFFFIDSESYYSTYTNAVARTRMLFAGEDVAAVLPDFALFPDDSSENTSRVDPWPPDSTREEEEVQQACRIPQMDPWDASVVPYVKRPKPFSCNEPPPLTHIIYPPLAIPNPSSGLDATSNSTDSANTRPPLPPLPRIVINENLKSKYGKGKDGDLKCCAGAVKRGNVVSQKDVRADMSYQFDKCQHFQNSTEAHSDFTLVQCTRGNKEVYIDMHSAVVPTKATIEKIAAASKGPLPPSVLLLGLDSSSRLNIHRAAPKFLKALKQVGAVEMNAYNKVGDNTLPNLLPILAGVSLDEANNKTRKQSKPAKGRGCWPNNKYVFDSCPLIWKNFSDKGYVTLFGEDEPNIAIFNYHKLGYRDPPTDHYLRPFYVVAEKRLKRKVFATATWCYANKDTFTRLLEYYKSFIDTYSGRAPFFSIMFITGIGHQNAANIELGDARLSDFVSYAVEAVEGRGRSDEGGGLFMGVFSDHGMRWGELRQSPLGWLEERLPFLFIRPPHAESGVHPGGNHSSTATPHSVLQENSNKLTSPFDFHETLSAVLHGGDARPKDSTCNKCYDLLSEVVPRSRTCEDASIPGQWCACASEESKPVDGETETRAASLAVEQLNSILKVDTMCSRLVLGRTISSNYRTLPTTKKGKRLKFLVVKFSTTPGEGIFEATVFVRNGNSLQVSPDLSRLNKYGNDSWCVDDPHKKLYCYCV